MLFQVESENPEEKLAVSGSSQAFKLLSIRRTSVSAVLLNESLFQVVLSFLGRRGVFVARVCRSFRCSVATYFARIDAGSRRLVAERETFEKRRGEAGHVEQEEASKLNQEIEQQATIDENNIQEDLNQLNSKIRLLEDFIKEINEEKQNGGFFSGRWNTFTSQELATRRDNDDSLIIFSSLLLLLVVGCFIVYMHVVLVYFYPADPSPNNPVSKALYFFSIALIHYLGASTLIVASLILLAAILILWGIEAVVVRLNFTEGSERFDRVQCGIFSQSVLIKTQVLRQEFRVLDPTLHEEIDTPETKKVGEIYKSVLDCKGRLVQQQNRFFTQLSKLEKNAHVESAAAVAEVRKSSLSLD